MLDPLLRPAAIAANDRFYGGSSLDLPAPPSFDFDFVGRPSLHCPGLPPLTFTRASTAARVNAAGLVETVAADAPRFDHHPVTGARLGLLFEEARVNLALRSRDFAHAAWTKDNAAAGGGAVAPDGNAGAQLLAEDTGTGQHRARQDGMPFAAGATLAVSCFLKSAGRGFATLQFGAANGFRACFNLAAGALAPGFAGASFGTGTFVSAGIQHFPAGWYRCWIVGKEDPAATSGEAYLNVVRSAAYTDSYAGDGASGVRAWGYQVETGLFPTSYIATTDATAARAVDVAALSTLSPWFNTEEGTLFAEAVPLDGKPTTIAHPIFGIYDGTNANQLTLSLLQDQSPSLVISVSGITVALPGGPSATAEETIRLAGAYRSGDRAASARGSQISSDAGTIPSGLNIVRLGRNFGAGVLNGCIRRVIYFPFRLTNNMLRHLTK